MAASSRFALTLPYGILWVFRTVEFKLSGHLRDRAIDPGEALKLHP